MAYDVAGNFTRLYKWATDAANGIKITTVRHDGEDDGFATAFNLAFIRDGRAPATGLWKMGGNKISGLGDATNAGDALSLNGSGGMPTSMDLTNAINVNMAEPLAASVLPVANGGTGAITLAAAGIAQVGIANVFTADQTIWRLGAPTTGVIFFGNTGTHYLFFDGTNFSFGGTGELFSPAGGFNGALTGNVTGNVSGSSSSCTGNSATATNATTAGSCTGNAATASLANTATRVTTAVGAANFFEYNPVSNAFEFYLGNVLVCHIDASGVHTP